MERDHAQSKASVMNIRYKSLAGRKPGSTDLEDLKFELNSEK